MGEKRVKYKASPTGAAFHKCDKVVKGIIGPVGSGKSVSCFMELFKLACEQWPNVMGIRKTRYVIIRNTYSELLSTSLRTFEQWFPPEVCTITYSPLIKGLLKLPLADGTTVESEFLFIAMDKEVDVKKLLSLEVSGAFLNESRELPLSILTAARGRVGRYPSKVDGYESHGKYKAPENPCRRKCVILDTNPPSDRHWIYDLAEVGYLQGTKPEMQSIAKADTRRIFQFFKNPPPLIKQEDGSFEPNPEGENIENLPGGYQYYLDMIAGSPPDYVDVMVLGNYGTIATGKPVYGQSYNDAIHCKDVAPIKGLPIAMGWDFGLTPSVVIGQLTSNGQLRILDELVGWNMSVREFARDVVKPYLSNKYSGYEVQFSVGDPAGNFRGEGTGMAAIGILNDDYVDHDGHKMVALDMGFMTEPAPTNDPTRRIDAVKTFLNKMTDGEPGFLLDKSCDLMRKGLQGQYQYKRLSVSGGVRFSDKPLKDEWSHTQDACQYMALGYVHGLDYNPDNDVEFYEDDSQGYY